MQPLIYEMTQGDPFYAELGFVDQNANPVDLSSWTLGVDIKMAYSDLSPLLSLTIADGGILGIGAGIIAINFPASAVTNVDINPIPRNGDLIPWRWLYGDLKMIPPSNIELAQGDGPRTPVFIKLFMGVTA